MRDGQRRGRIRESYHADIAVILCPCEEDLRQCPQGAYEQAQGLAQASVLSWIALYKAAAHTRPRREVRQDSDIRWSAQNGVLDVISGKFSVGEITTTLQLIARRDYF